MPVIYDGSHSVTFIKGTVSTGYVVRRTWCDFHLIPEKATLVTPRNPQTVIVDVPFSSRSSDYTDSIGKGLHFEPTNGEWTFYIDHDAWPNWYETKEEIEAFINGQALWCVIEDDHDYVYKGRFVVSNWDDGSDYSSITIGYDIDEYCIDNPFIYNVVPAFYEDTISDSWEDIIASVKDGSYDDKYHIGDIKNVEIKGVYGVMPMQIVAKRSDSTPSYTNAPITWISRESLITTSRMYNDLSYGTGSVAWTNSLVHNLVNSLESRLPEVLRRNIVRAKKYRYYSSNYPTETWDYEKIWIPSYREIFGGTTRETQGTNYSDIFSDDTSRIRKLHSLSSSEGSNSGSSWWLRSVGKNSEGNSFERVSYNGTSSILQSTNDIGVVFGFCT